MLKKLLIITSSIANTTLLICMICLGSQNLSNKYSLNLGIGVTEKYPSGFLIGISVSLGYLSGGITSGLLIKGKNKKFANF